MFFSGGLGAKKKNAASRQAADEAVAGGPVAEPGRCGAFPPPPLAAPTGLSGLSSWLPAIHLVP